MGPYILGYYRAQGGNPSGIPVEVMSINIQSGADAQTQAFIDQYGLELVLDDPQRVVWHQYGEGYIPRFAIINGAPAANYGQWEILFMEHGYYPGRYIEFRSIVDSVVPEPGTLSLLAIGALVVLCGSQVRWLRRVSARLRTRA